MHVSNEDKAIIEEVLGTKLAQWLIVSQAILTDETYTQYENCEVEVEKCEGKVCPRCWNIHQGEHECCDRCIDVLKKDYPEVPVE